MLDPDEFDDLNRQCRDVLAGHGPEVQGAVLADLLATYLAGHFVAEGEDDNPAQTADLREQLLQLHVAAVRTLIPVNEAIQRERRERRHSH